MHDEPNFIDDKNEQACLERIADLEQELKVAAALLGELVGNKHPYTGTNANSVGEHCNFCKAIIYNHEDPIPHKDDCLITRARKLVL